MQTLEVVREARFAAAFTFQYSIRPGTPAATMPDQVPPEVVRERYERLVEVVNEISWAENQKLLGSRVELLVAEGEGRKDAATHRLTGRARDNRLVHFTSPPVEEGTPAPGEAAIRPGDLVEVEITYAAPHHLVADGPVLAHRRTRSGDAWEARTAPAPPNAVGLGMPTIGTPPALEPSVAAESVHGARSLREIRRLVRRSPVAAGVLRRVAGLRGDALRVLLGLLLVLRVRSRSASPAVVAVARARWCRARRRSTPGRRRSARPARC